MARTTAEWVSSRRFALSTQTVSGVGLAWIVRTCIFVSFTFAFLQYEIHSGISQFLHLAALFLAGLLVLCGRHRTERLQNLFRGGPLLLTAVLFSEAISYISGDMYSTLYGLVFLGVVLASRLVVQEIGVANVMRAYSQAAMVTAGYVCLSGRRSLFATEGRFTGGTSVHPNLVSFFLGGYFCVLVWRAMEYRVRWRRRVATGLALATLLFIFLAGSRGTLSALLIAGLALGFRKFFKREWLQHFRLRHVHAILILIAVPLVLGYLLQHSRLAHIGDYLNTQLSLNSSQRGLKSGLSGRTNFWHVAFLLLRQQDRWLFGFGYRAGDRLVGTIDNGYVQLLFESGLIAGSMILGSMAQLFVRLWRASKPAENNAWTRYYTMMWCLMIVYFFNNISTRYLFSFGSSFSICVILLMTASRQELVGAAKAVPVQERPPAQPGRLGRLAWSRSER